jgi:YihY family inner membrane protein
MKMDEKEKKGFFQTLWLLLIGIFKTAQYDIVAFWKYISNPQWRKKLWADLSNFVRSFYQIFNKERILREAGALTYITIMGFVPVVVFLIFLAPTLPFLDLKNKIFAIISENLIPSVALQVQNIIQNMLETKAGFNIINFIVIAIASYSLFIVIRDSFDRILKLEFRTKPGLLSQIIKFLGTLILGLLIMIVLLSTSSLPVISGILKLPVFKWFSYLVPFVMQFIILLLLYSLMPSVSVKTTSLVRGAFWATIIWSIARGGFDFYIYNLTTYPERYGAVSALPIFLLWIYVNWVIIMSGMVMVSVYERRRNNKETLESPQQMLRVTVEMYSDSKLNKRIEKLLAPDKLKDIVYRLDKDEDK